MNKLFNFIMKTLKKGITLFMLLIAFQAAFAQKAEIYGVVKDASTNDVLPGATVAIVGTNIGTITNQVGEFRISNITPGTYTLAFSYIGFLTEKIEIELTAGESEQDNMLMVFDAVNIGEIVVSTQILGQARAMNQQLNADAIVNVVSSDKIKELPDVNAAEAIGRLPGVSVTRVGGEASKVIVRGLSPKLTTITINGIKVPASSTTDRSVDLSNISPELLSGIEVFKSPTADMDGDAIGGVVNLNVMKAPDKPVAIINVNGGYGGLNKTWGNYKGSVDLSKRFLNNKLGIALKGNYENTNRSSEGITSTWDVIPDTIENDILINDTKLQDDVRIIQRMGGNLGLDYQYKSGYIMGQGFLSQRRTDVKHNEDFLVDGTSVEHNPRHTKSNNTTYQALLDGKQRFSIFEMSWTLGTSKVIIDNYYDASVIIFENDGQIPTGNIYTVEEKIAQRTYNTQSAYLKAYNSEPSVMNQQNYTAALDFKMDYSLGDKISGFLKLGGKYRTDHRTNEIDYYTQWQYYLDDNLNDEAVQNLLPYVTETGMASGRKIMMSNFADGSNNLPIYGGKYEISPSMNMDFLDYWHERNLGSAKKNTEKPYENYTVDESVAAVYIMPKIKYSYWFTLIPGIRYEYSDNAYKGVFSTLNLNDGGYMKDTTTYQNYGDILPSVHLKISPKDWFDVRLSAVKTISKPDYNMVTPRSRVDATNARLYRGNPDLKHTVAWNYDAMVSFFTNKLGLVTLGGFYKKFDNYFSKIPRTMSVDEALSLGYPALVFDVREDYVNFDNSEVKGLEMDVQTNFSFLASPFNGIVVNANVTKLWSSTKVPLFHKVEYYDAALRRFVVDFDQSYIEFQDTKLPNQTDWVGNLAIGYDYKGFSSRISMIYQSDYKNALSQAGEITAKAEKSYKYTDAYMKFDVSLSQKVGKHVKIRANWYNITNETERSYQYISKYGLNEDSYGMTFDLGMQYKF